MLTGKEGGSRMCCGEQVKEPTATTAFTGIVKIYRKGRKQYKCNNLNQINFCVIFLLIILMHYENQFYKHMYAYVF